MYLRENAQEADNKTNRERKILLQKKSAKLTSWSSKQDQVQADVQHHMIFLQVYLKYLCTSGVKMTKRTHSILLLY